MNQDKQSVLLIGGMSGTGKSTLAGQIEAEYGPGSYNIEFGNIYSEIGGDALSQSQQGDNFRELIWGPILLGEIRRKLEHGYDLVIANSTFLRRERRDQVLDGIGRSAAVVAILIVRPLLTSFHRIKINRPVGLHNVNRQNAREQIMRATRFFIAGDNSDLLLPSDINLLPNDYKAILTRNDNSFLVNSLSNEQLRRWVMATFDLSAFTCIDLIRSGITEPMMIRDYLETHRPK